MNYLRKVDIAHPPLHSGRATELLDELLRDVHASKELRALKIVHGAGSIEKVAVLKTTVLDWVFRNKKRIRASIPGEQYSLFDRTTQEMRKECGQLQDSDLGASNAGVTIIWVK